MSMNKFLIPSVLVATILVAGAFAFIQIDKVSTVHFEILDAIIGIPGVTNQDIADELKDKLKLMVNFTDIETPTVVDGTTVDGYLIFVEALDENKENVPFNLKEIYLCGTATQFDSLNANRIFIEDVEFDEDNLPIAADILISDINGGPMLVSLITDNSGCVEVLSALANNGRAGAMGLGSDKELVVLVRGEPGDFVDFVKCIAFTPNAAGIISN